MRKVNFTEKVALQVIREIFENSGIADFGQDEITVPKEWRGKSVIDALNVHYYTFKHRPLTTTELVVREIQNGVSTNTLQALTRSFCLLYLGQLKRVYAKDVDIFEVPVNLEFWIQTSKIQLLEMLISECNIGLIGNRLTIAFDDNNTRRAAVQFGNLNVVDVLTGQPCGEMTVVNCECTMVFSPNIADYSDYTIAIKKNESEYEELPLFNFQAERTMIAKSVPYMQNPRTTGNINLSNAKTLTLGFYGYRDSWFVNSLMKETLSDDNNDNNKIYTCKIGRTGEPSDLYIEANFVVSKHNVSVETGTGYETHTLTLVISGIR